MTGMDLKLRRVAARVSAKALGSAMEPPVSSSRIGHIESRDVVTDEAARRYIEALETLTTVPAPAATPEPASAA